MKKNIRTTRMINIIKRAIEDYNFNFDIYSSMDEISLSAENMLMGKGTVDYVDECETNSDYTHILWQDRNGYVYEADGECISSDDSQNVYYRKDVHGNFSRIEWFEHDENDYILMGYDLDSEARLVALVCK